MISVKDVYRKFTSGGNSFNALLSINLEIKQGEFIALVGPSGSGKTTLLNLIGGLDTPSQGSIKVENKNLHRLSDKQLSLYRNDDIGFIFQEFHLEPYLNVKENVMLPTFFNHKSENINKYADKLIKEVGLEIKAQTKANQLSGGQKQRTAIARALINKPKILLADEPTGNLDLKTGQTIIDLIKKSHQNHNLTVIIATHDPQIAKTANRIIKIKDGKISL